MYTQLMTVLGEVGKTTSPCGDKEEARWTLTTPTESTAISGGKSAPAATVGAFDTAAAAASASDISAQPQRPGPELVLRTATATDRMIPGSDKAWIDEIGFWVDDGGEDALGESNTVATMGSGESELMGKVAFVPLPRTAC